MDLEIKLFCVRRKIENLIGPLAIAFEKGESRGVDVATDSLLHFPNLAPEDFENKRSQNDLSTVADEVTVFPSQAQNNEASKLCQICGNRNAIKTWREKLSAIMTSILRFNDLLSYLLTWLPFFAKHTPLSCLRLKGLSFKISTVALMSSFSHNPKVEPTGEKILRHWEAQLRDLRSDLRTLYLGYIHSTTQEAQVASTEKLLLASLESNLQLFRQLSGLHCSVPYCDERLEHFKARTQLNDCYSFVSNAKSLLELKTVTFSPSWSARTLEKHLAQFWRHEIFLHQRSSRTERNSPHFLDALRKLENDCQPVAHQWIEASLKSFKADVAGKSSQDQADIVDKDRKLETLLTAMTNPYKISGSINPRHRLLLIEKRREFLISLV
ncbi:hypothetical protein F4604DRAFT_1918625 [Suillus subluteus]|nr:hypothetical protein F4604DRAFT_1918625 [Suillus subluteus]